MASLLRAFGALPRGNASFYPLRQFSSAVTPAQRLRKGLSAPEILVAPGCYDAFTGTLIEKASFKACYLSGAGVSYSHTGRPDIGLVTQTEMVARIAALAEAVDIPIIADGDTGYGNAVNVMRTVKMYEQVGCSAIQLEDQQFPKRCGHLAGKELISAQEMAGKVRAACDARRSDDFVVIARTDALATHGMEEALNRAELYVNSGADIIFVESPANQADLEAVAARLGGKVPLLANMVEGGKTPLFKNKELEDMGYSIVIYPNAILRGVAKVGADILEDLKANDTTRESLHRMRDFKELNKLLGIDDFKALESKYLPKA
eukprot:TRINITY_DN110277_c0_g1_i1.p1 TRINITY_DN110277_c0_g1~~TRINITY_DN110277_c0_g1_i1.p1  ORF type:complete len:319 (-),score=79.90 TRINITY_DN110277_c0_g1_i1:128-1084(-)